MKNRFSRLIVGALLSLSMIAGGAVAANATPQAVMQVEPPSVASAGLASDGLTEFPETTDPETAAALEKTAAFLLAAVTTGTDGAKTFDFGQAVVAGATVAQAQDFANGFTSTGGSVVNSPEGMTFAQLSATKSLELGQALQAISACSGRTQVWKDVWGTHSEVNSCTANKLIAILTIGGGAEALIGALAAAFAIPVAGWVAAAAVALITIGAGAIAYCAANGNGITLHITGVPWCGAQT